MIEYFDVVDIQDIPTGKQTFSKEAHSKAILHRCVAVFVFNSKDDLYIQRRHGGLLDHTVGGHVSAGEDYQTASVRESEEEIGLTEPLREVALSVYSDETYNRAKDAEKIRHMFGIFECRPSPAWHFEPNDEVQELFPQPLELTVQQMTERPGRFTQGFINTLAKYIEVRGLGLNFDKQKCLENWSEL